MAPCTTYNSMKDGAAGLTGVGAHRERCRAGGPTTPPWERRRRSGRPHPPGRAQDSEVLVQEEQLVSQLSCQTDQEGSIPGGGEPVASNGKQRGRRAAWRGEYKASAPTEARAAGTLQGQRRATSERRVVQPAPSPSRQAPTLEARVRASRQRPAHRGLRGRGAGFCTGPASPAIPSYPRRESRAPPTGLRAKEPPPQAPLLTRAKGVSARQGGRSS